MAVSKLAQARTGILTRGNETNAPPPESTETFLSQIKPNNGGRRVREKAGEPPEVHTVPEQHDHAAQGPDAQEPRASAQQNGISARHDHRHEKEVSIGDAAGRTDDLYNRCINKPFI